MKVAVISLGGSVFVPDSINFRFLDEFKKVLRKNYSKMKFVIVAGGGSIARKYIRALESEHKSNKEVSLAGIRVTRMNAIFLMQFLGKGTNGKLPLNMEEVTNSLRKNNVVVCGALRYEKDETSDSTAAKLANRLGTDFINITNVPGLFSADPKIHRDAKFIPSISWGDFDRIISKIKFSAGQHFVLDQDASKIIRKHRIRTYIIGPDVNNFNNLINGRKFRGTTIAG